MSNNNGPFQPPCYLPPSHSLHAPNCSHKRPPETDGARNMELPRKIGPQPMDRQPPSADETMIMAHLPRRPWAEALIRVARFFTIMDKLAEQLEHEGDHLYMADVHPLARGLLDGCDPESLLVAEVLLSAEPTETGLSVLHSAQCDAEEHGPDGNCHWRRNLARGHFALL